MYQITEKTVTFETAKAAASVKFPCFAEEQVRGIYCTVNTWYEVATGKLWQEHRDGIRINYSEEGVYKKWQTTIKAPTQSVLQAWLREVHKILVYLLPDTKTGKWGYGIASVGDIHTEGNRFELDVTIGTYEEALEEALQVALKMLKDKQENYASNN